jgi:hypothetical protein
MNAGRVAVIGAVATLVSWALKALAIWSAGGAESPLVGVLWALGILTMVITFIALGVHLFGSRPVWQRVVAGILAAVLGLVVFFFVEESVGSLVDESAGWVREEVGLWAFAVLLVVVVLASTRSRGSTHRMN